MKKGAPFWLCLCDELFSIDCHYVITLLCKRLIIWVEDSLNEVYIDILHAFIGGLDALFLTFAVTLTRILSGVVPVFLLLIHRVSAHTHLLVDKRFIGASYSAFGDM